MVCQRRLHHTDVLDLEPVSVQEHLDDGPHLVSRKLVPTREHPRKLGEDDVGNEERRVRPEKGPRGARLLLLVLEH